MNKAPKIAIVCDFLTTMGGAENVVLELHKMYPDAPIFTAVYSPDAVPLFNNADVRVSKLQRLPKILQKTHKLLPTLAVSAMRQLDLSEYDIIIASTYLHGHQITKTSANQKLIAYCHTPPRYYWSHYEQYKKQPGYGKLDWLIRLAMPLLVPRQRKLDLEAANKVDVYIANSNEVKQRIQRYYSKNSTVIHPPVDTKRFIPQRERGDHYVTIGRQLPYKRYDLAVKAATKLNLPLHVFGNGPEHEKLVAMAGSSVQFFTDRFGDASNEAYEASITTAKGFIYAAEEDFGIVTVEAMAAGAPVIAYKKAGTLDIVTDESLGELFENQQVDSVVAALQVAQQKQYIPARLHRAAKRFDSALFQTKIRKIVTDAGRSN